MIVITEIKAKHFHNNTAYFDSIKMPEFVSMGEVESFSPIERERVDGTKIIVNGNEVIIGFTEAVNSIVDFNSIIEELRKTQSLLELETTKFLEIKYRYIHTKAYVREFKNASFLKRLIYLITGELKENDK